MHTQFSRQAAQGDVLIERAEAIPASARRIENPILALGETGGHGHVICGEGVEVFEDENGIYLDVREEAALRHLLVASGIWTGEHHEIPTEPGIYYVSRQFEYNPYERAIEEVSD